MCTHRPTRQPNPLAVLFPLLISSRQFVGMHADKGLRLGIKHDRDTPDVLTDLSRVIDCTQGADGDRNDRRITDLDDKDSSHAVPGFMALFPKYDAAHDFSFRCKLPMKIRIWTANHSVPFFNCSTTPA